MKQLPATKAEWKTKPLPKKRAVIHPGCSYSNREMQRIKLGLIPEQMEDKWFAFFENETLYFHRSWTGYGIYVVHFSKTGSEYAISSVEVNRNAKQWDETDDSYEASMVLYLIDVLLLNKQADFPSHTDTTRSDLDLLKEWSSVGNAMFSKGVRKKAT